MRKVIEIEGIEGCWWVEKEYESGLHRRACKMYRGDRNKWSVVKYEAAHSCFNNRCVNPMHLEWKDKIDNELDKVKRNLLRRMVVDDLIDSGIMRNTYLSDIYPLDYVHLTPIEQVRIDEIIRRKICKDLMTQWYNLELIEDILLRFVSGSWRVVEIPGPTQNWLDGPLLRSPTYLSKIKKLNHSKIRGALGIFSQIFLEMQGLILEDEEG